MTKSRFSTALTRCVLVGLIGMQLLIPAGTMPSASGSGWLLQLCPDGLTPAAMAVLHAGHSNQPEDPHSAHHGHAEQQPTHSASAYDCDLATLAGDVLAPAPTTAPIAPSFGENFSSAASTCAPHRFTIQLRARAPPETHDRYI